MIRPETADVDRASLRSAVDVTASMTSARMIESDELRAPLTTMTPENKSAMADSIDLIRKTRESEQKT